MAQISFSFSGGFWPSSLPLFHGAARLSVLVAVSMNGSSVEGKEPHVDPVRRAQYDPERSLDAPERRHLVAGKSSLSRPGACTIESGGIPVPNQARAGACRVTRAPRSSSALATKFSGESE